MPSWLDPILETALRAFAGEGERIVRAKALGAGIRVIRGVRGILFIHYIIQAMTFLAALSFFAGGWLAFESYQQQGAWAWSWPLGFCAGVFALSAGALALSLRERTWVRVFRLEELIESTLRVEAAPLARPSGQSADVELIAQVVEQVMERKLREKRDSSAIS